MIFVVAVLVLLLAFVLGWFAGIETVRHILKRERGRDSNVIDFTAAAARRQLPRLENPRMPW